MLNLKQIVLNPQFYIQKLNTREVNFDFAPLVKDLIKMYEFKNLLLQEFEQNQFNIKQLASQFQNQPITELREKAIYLKKINHQFRSILNFIDQKLEEQLYFLPNVPHPSVPIGDETKFIIVKEHFDYPNQSFVALKNQKFVPHYELLDKLAGWELKNTVQMTSSRFITYQNWSAILLRALKNFLFDFHAKNGYSEINAPYLINQKALYATGQFPKSIDDCYHVAETDLYLIPTAETTLINLMAHQTFADQQLPLKLAAYSPCFRKEAGAAGKDTRGAIRLHQFHKIELVQFCLPETSYQSLEELTNHIVKILQILQIPYRIISLATHDLAFQSSKTYDVEVWWPSQKRFLEISSISNTETFQTLPLKITTQNKAKVKRLVHALNGSGLALDRLLAVVIEYAFNPTTQTWNWPTVLKPYLPKNWNNYF